MKNFVKTSITAIALLLITLSNSTSLSAQTKWVTTYYPNWMFMPSTNSIYYAIPPQNMKFQGITHVIQFGNGNITTTAPYFTPINGGEWVYGPGGGNINYRDSLIHHAHRQGAKVLICIQAAQNGTPLNTITQSQATTDAFAASVANYVRQCGYDGVDVNWETNVGDKTQTSRLITALRRELGAEAIITLSPLSGGWGRYDAAVCNANVDQINPQCYDLSDAWNPNISQNGNWFLNPLHEGTGRPANFEGRSYETRGPLQWVANGFNRSIMGIGVAAFGRIYTGNTDLYQSHSGRYELGLYDIQRYLQNGMTEIWDDGRAAHYAKGTSTSSFTIPYVGTVAAGSKSFVTYMTKRSVDSLTQWVRRESISGVMLYDMSYDADKSKPFGQTNAIHNAVIAAFGDTTLPPLPPPPPPPVDTTAPSITWVRPTTSSVAGSIVLEVTATDNYGVSSVEYRLDTPTGTLLDEQQTAPYDFTWNTTSVSDGNHAIYAIVRDPSGNAAQSVKQIVVQNVVTPPPAPDTLSPTVLLITPVHADTVSGNVSVTASATDDRGVARVEFLIDGSVATTDNSAPYSYVWNVTGLSGVHTVSARAFDQAGNVGISTSASVTVFQPLPQPDLENPSVTLVSPQNGDTISGLKTLTATAADNQGVTVVQFLVDGSVLGSDSTSPYSYVWNTNGSTGNHTVQARAQDAAGNTSLTSAVQVTVTFEQGPAKTDLPIFEDNLHSPWTDRSWATTNTFGSTERAFSGAASIKSTTSAWGGLQVHSGQVTSSIDLHPDDYSSVQFAVYTATSGLSLQIALQNDARSSFPMQTYSNIPTNRWVLISYPMSTLNPNGLIFHEVMIQNFTGSQKTFYVDNFELVGAAAAPVAPGPQVPVNGAANLQTDVTLAWDPSPGALAYRLQVSTSPTFGVLFFEDSTLTTTSQLISSLANSQTYYWRVRAKNSSGESPFSVAYNFTTIEGTAVLSTNRRNIDYGKVAVGTHKKDSVLVTNTGSSPVTITELASSAQQYSGEITSSTISPGNSAKVYVTFSPHDRSLVTARLLISCGSCGVQETVAVTGRGALPPKNQRNRTTMLFTSVPSGSVKVDSFTVSNTGEAPLEIYGIQSTNSIFTVSPSTANIPESASMMFYVTAAPGTDPSTSGYLVFDDNDFSSNDSLSVQLSMVMTTPDNQYPAEYHLQQNYPNPFNPNTMIAYSLPVPSTVSLTIFNVLGEEVVKLVDNGVQSIGEHRVAWEGQDIRGQYVTSGLYFYRLEAIALDNPNQQFSEIKKMVLMK